MNFVFRYLNYKTQFCLQGVGSKHVHFSSSLGKLRGVVDEYDQNTVYETQIIENSTNNWTYTEDS